MNENSSYCNIQTNYVYKPLGVNNIVNNQINNQIDNQINQIQS
jgi:hypothetical protein